MKYRATSAARSNSDRSPLYDVRNHACDVLGEDNECEVMFRGRRLNCNQSVGDQTIWWSQTGSNRRPHACKARALPAELWPRNQKTNAHSMKVVGLGRLELPTSRLSSARSNQLSYKPLTLILCRTLSCEGLGILLACAIGSRRYLAQRSPWRVFVREERETKTAKSRQWSSTILKLLAPECF
jgi:hypothetical protein